MSNNLGRTNVVVNQANKEVTIAASDDALDAAITSSITYTWSGAQTLKTASTAETQGNLVFVLAGSTSGSPSFKFGSVQRGVVIVHNTMGVTVPVSDFAGGDTINVPAGQAMAMYVTASGLETIYAPTSLSAASTTEALTATDTTKYLTADALAALWEKGADVASAATVTLGEGGMFHITGTTTITDIDWSVATNGRFAWLIFDGVLTLTHNATTLVLPTGANITTAAGDRALFMQDNADNVYCMVYQRADGSALAGGGSFTAASTTEVLTGTDSSKGATPDSVAALWEQGADVASAATISLGEGGHFNITGTTTITDIDFTTDKAGRMASLVFAGALTLTHNASTLILPGGANIVTAAGDVAIFRSEGTDVVRCISYTRANGQPVRVPASITVAASDETTALTTGTAKVTFRMPYAMTLTEVRASLTTAQTAGSTITFDINEAGVSILSTKLTIDNNEKTSTTAATPAVISDTALADDAEMTVDIDTVGTSGATGLKITLIGYRS